MARKIIISRSKECNWWNNESHGKLRWRLVIDSTKTMTSRMSLGILKI